MSLRGSDASGCSGRAPNLKRPLQARERGIDFLACALALCTEIVEVLHRRCERGVPHPVLDGPHIHPCSEVHRGKGVAEGVLFPMLAGWASGALQSCTAYAFSTIEVGLVRYVLNATDQVAVWSTAVGWKDQVVATMLSSEETCALPIYPVRPTHFPQLKLALYATFLMRRIRWPSGLPQLAGKIRWWLRCFFTSFISATSESGMGTRLSSRSLILKPIFGLLWMWKIFLSKRMSVHSAYSRSEERRVGKECR